MSDYFGKETFKLGFGLMRLPKLPSGKIDIAQVSEMVDRFIAAGGTYFDTAFVYDNGESEAAARKALENALTMQNVSYGTKITYKMLVSAGLIALAVVLPQLVHLALGQSGGVQWLPMYLPVLIGGCLLGTKWGLAVGMLSPLMSFVITSAMGNPMPVVARLPFMMAELAVFAVISGLFTKKISDDGLWAFPAVILAQVTGRATFLGLIALTQSFTQFTPSMIWTQIQTGFIGLLVQALLVPVIIIGLRKLMVREND